MTIPAGTPCLTPACAATDATGGLRLFRGWEMTNQIPVGLSGYQSYRNLPALAGLGTMTDAMGIGLSVEECVRRLKRHHWTWRRLHQIFIARLTAEPIYELKMGFSLHAHYAAEHAAAWRRRVGEMREPPLGLDVVPDPFLDAFFDEIGSTPGYGGARRPLRACGAGSARRTRTAHG